MIRRSWIALCATLLAALAPVAVPAATPPTLDTVLAAHDWINGPVDMSQLHGKVVIVDIFTFGCYNCKNVTPNLKKLHADLSPSEFAIVGVHCPETPYERDRSNVVSNLKEQGVTWPVAVDNEFRVWKSWGIEYWPTQLIFDRKGNLRKTVIGDSQDDLVDSTVKGLLAER